MAGAVGAVAPNLLKNAIRKRAKEETIRESREKGVNANVNVIVL